MLRYLWRGDSIITIMMNAGLGLAGLIVIIFLYRNFTTFMDAYSAGVSSTTIYNSASSKGIAVIVTIVGTIAAILYPMDDITDFLYLIGSVFAPMIAIFWRTTLSIANKYKHYPLISYEVLFGPYPLVYTTICYIESTIGAKAASLYNGILRNSYRWLHKSYRKLICRNKTTLKQNTFISNHAYEGVLLLRYNNLSVFTVPVSITNCISFAFIMGNPYAKVRPIHE